MAQDFLIFSPSTESETVTSHLKISLFPYDNEMITGRLSSSFHDFGRDSLGILPDDFGKQSLGFLNDKLNSSLNKSNCAVDIFSNYEDIVDGRESLGILELFKTFNKDDTKMSNILLTVDENADESVCDIFSTLNTSVQNTFQGSESMPFNKASFEEPSKIYKLSSNSEICHKTYTKSSCGSVLSILNKGFHASEPECRTRAISLPESNTDKIGQNSHNQPNSRNFHNATYSGPNNVDNDDEFHDSVFIEGKYIAHTIADGSILDDSFKDEMGNLDNIPPPTWNDCAELETSLEYDTNLPSESDKFENVVSSTNLHNTSSISTSVEVESNHNSSRKSIDVKESLRNLSDLLNTGFNHENVREGREILSSLAEFLCGDKSIIKSPHLDDSGHSSSIIEQNNSENLQYRNDHFSNTPNEDNLGKRLSLSLNSASLDTKVQRPKIYKKANISNIDVSKIRNISKNSSTKSDGPSNGSLELSSLPITLKNKSGDIISKKGPMKAVIPIKNMKKKGAKWETPEKATSSDKKTMPSKKISTPVHGPKLIPVAASTPAVRQAEHNPVTTSAGKTLQYSSPQSKYLSLPKSRYSLPSPNHSGNNQSGEHNRLSQLNTSSSSTTSNKEKSVSALPTLRKSSTQISYKDTKKSNSTENKLRNIYGRVRSNSLGSVPTGIMSSMNKIRENLLNSPEYKKITKSVLKENINSNNRASLGNNKKSIETKLLKSKKLGKENFSK